MITQSESSLGRPPAHGGEERNSRTGVARCADGKPEGKRKGERERRQGRRSRGCSQDGPSARGGCPETDLGERLQTV